MLDRGYPEDNIAVETVILKKLGESGRNTLRCDVIVYDVPATELEHLAIDARIARAIIVAEIKRDSNRKVSAWKHQLEPAMRLLPGMGVMGAYWDDVNRLLFAKQIVKDDLQIFEDSLANLPVWGAVYRRKLLTYVDLTENPNLVGVLFNIANVMRSQGINDEHVRYKETVKLLLARYCDERESEGSLCKPLALQIYPEGRDPKFMDRVAACYGVAAKRYSRAKTIFGRGQQLTELPERTLREIVKQIQGINFRAASNETMQQVFMSFVPAVFKKSLDQYFTPIGLVKAMVEMSGIGPNDKIADPGMGTADFLTAAAEFRIKAGDTDILQRVYGFDSDQKAFDLAVVNMILNKDGQSNLFCQDSIEHHDRFEGEMGIVLCNPPFGEQSVETRASVLRHYDLGHEWEYGTKSGQWKKTERLASRQQLGILFIERCYKMLGDKGRLAIILPEGYLSTPMYGYVRQWLIDHLRILCVVELPRRIFVKSNADLRSNILIGQRLSAGSLKRAKDVDYPIQADMVRKVGFKTGKGYRPLFLRDRDTGIEIRDEDNDRITDTDFRRVVAAFAQFTEDSQWGRTAARRLSAEEWRGARISDVTGHPNLDLKPRRLMSGALQNLRDIRNGTHFYLSEIAEIVTETTNILEDGPAKLWRLVAGMDIRAVEGIVTPSHPTRAWQIADRKQENLYPCRSGDIIIGLVRPERRNIGILLADGDDIVGTPDGIAVVRVRRGRRQQYPQEWLFATLRSEACRLQFWTESGGTSYGKLTREHLEHALIPVPPLPERKAIAERVTVWARSVKKGVTDWVGIGDDRDRKPIINSSGFGLIDTDDELGEDDDD